MISIPYLHDLYQLVKFTPNIFVVLRDQNIH